MRLLIAFISCLISVSVFGQISFCGNNVTAKNLIGLEIKIIQPDSNNLDDLEFTLYENLQALESSSSSYHKWMFDEITNRIIIDYNNFNTFSIPLDGSKCTWRNKRRKWGTKNTQINKNGYSFNCQSTLLEECVKRSVEDSINTWQKKGEFEKISSYNARVNNESRIKKINEFQIQALNWFKNFYQISFYSSSNSVILNTYDPENETFLIQFIGYGSIVLNVPIDEGQYFRDNFSANKFNEVDFIYHKGQFVLSYVKYIDSDRIYEYSISEDYKYTTTEITYEFEAIDLSYSETINTDNIVTGTQTINNISSTQEIAFQSSDSTFYINSIAVIPKEIKTCDGSVSSADELASFTETHILTHYNVTDRRHLEALLDEQKLQASGLTYEETIIERGCIENAQAYLFVREGCLKGDEIIELRLVHCETSTLVWSCVGKNASIDEVLDRINEELTKD